MDGDQDNFDEIEQNQRDTFELATELTTEFLKIDSFSPNLIFDLLYKNYDTEKVRLISRNERLINNYTSPSLTYGEISFHGFEELMCKLYNHGLLPMGGNFIDIGCGSGKPVYLLLQIVN